MEHRNYSIEQLGQGKYRSVIGLRPTHVNRGAGFVAIESGLGLTGDANLTLGSTGLTDFRIRPRLSGNAPVLHFGHGTTHIRLTPLGTNNIGGVVKGDSITFPGAWANADLAYAYGGHLVREAVLLKAGHPASFAFRIDENNGLNLETMASPDFKILNPSLERGAEIVPLQWVKSTSGGKIILTVMLPPGNWAGWVLDPTLTAQPDATAGIDNYLQSGSPNTNFGTATSIYLGQITNVYRSLIKFDLSSITAGSTVTSAILSLWLSSSGATYADTNATGQVYRVLRAWGETTSTWNTYDGSNNWGTAGCANTTSDREASNIGTSAYATTDAVNTEHQFTLTASKIQEMIPSGVFTNNGFLIKVGTEADTTLYANHSSDGATAGYRPKLVVDYTLPAAAGVQKQYMHYARQRSV